MVKKMKMKAGMGKCSKKGPKVKTQAQATSIMLSEARKKGLMK